jgi:DNA-binding NarL/FixJ family response regulator
VIRVLIVDDHHFFRQCLVDLVNASEGLEAVGECADGSEVLGAVRDLGPDVVLMDLRMGATSGIAAAAALQRHGELARVLMLTSDTARASREAARAHGAVGYLMKGWSAEVVVRAIRHVAAGGTVWAEELGLACAARL